MRFFLLILLGFLLAAFTYLGLERLGRRGWVALGFRAVGWSALFVLLADLTCSSRPVTGARPVVLLDRSLSLQSAGARGVDASDSARRWGDIRYFGDDRPGTDSAYRGRSVLAPALTAALASGRPLIIVSDGEVDDASEVPPDLLGLAEVRLFARERRPDVALSAVTGPAHATAGDTVRLEVEARAAGGWPGDSIQLEVSDEGRVLARGRATLRDGGDHAPGNRRPHRQAVRRRSSPPNRPHRSRRRGAARRRPALPALRRRDAGNRAAGGAPRLGQPDAVRGARAGRRIAGSRLPDDGAGPVALDAGSLAGARRRGAAGGGARRPSDPQGGAGRSRRERAQCRSPALAER